MAYNLYEWKCPKCGKTAWGRVKDKVSFIKRVVFCKKCPSPMVGTGVVRKHYTLTELL